MTALSFSVSVPKTATAPPSPSGTGSFGPVPTPLPAVTVTPESVTALEAATSSTRLALPPEIVTLLAPAPLTVRSWPTDNSPIVRLYVPAGTTTVSPADEYLMASRSVHT